MKQDNGKWAFRILMIVSCVIAGAGIYGALATPEKTGLVLLSIILLIAINIFVAAQGR